MLPIHKELSKLDTYKTQMDYDATSLPQVLRGIMIQCILK